MSSESRMQRRARWAKLRNKAAERWRPDCWDASWRNWNALGLQNGQAFRSRGEALGLEVGVGHEDRLVQGDLGLLRRGHLSHFVL